MHRLHRKPYTGHINQQFITLHNCNHIWYANSFKQLPLHLLFIYLHVQRISFSQTKEIYVLFSFLFSGSVNRIGHRDAFDAIIGDRKGIRNCLDSQLMHEKNLQLGEDNEIIFSLYIINGEIIVWFAEWHT